jgi:hypothetical protein
MNLSFLAVLPPPGMDLPEMEQALPPTDLALVKDVPTRDGTVVLPRFSPRTQRHRVEQRVLPAADRGIRVDDVRFAASAPS